MIDSLALRFTSLDHRCGYVFFVYVYSLLVSFLANIASWIFLFSVCLLDRKTFLTNCCVMVDAHCICDGVLMLFVIALNIAVVSTPSFVRKLLSSVTTIAFMRSEDISGY